MRPNLGIIWDFRFQRSAGLKLAAEHGNRELKQQTFSAQRRQPEVTLTSDSRFPPLWLAVATRRQRHIACFAVVSKTWDFFSPLCLKDKFFLLLIHCFKIVPVCFSQDGRQTTQTNVSFFILFRFCTKSCCANDRQILQLFFTLWLYGR